MRSSISSFSEREALFRLLLTSLFIVLMVEAGLVYHFTSPLSIRSQDNYLGTVLDMREKLKNTQNGKPRVLLVGGSSLGFSVSAKNLSVDLGLPVYNLGVNAGFGYRNIWESYREFTDPKNDLIVLSPTYSMFLRGSWYSPQQCDVVFLSKSPMWLVKHPECIPVTVWRTFQDNKPSYNVPLNKDAIYRRSGHNQFGDVVTHLGKKNRKVDYELARDFLKVEPWQVQQYIDFIQEEIIKTGYSVVVVPNLIPEQSCGEDTDVLRRIFVQLAELNNQSGGDIRWPQPVFCIPDTMFFNTAYHVNDAGRNIKTEIFKQWIDIALGDSDVKRSANSPFH